MDLVTFSTFSEKYLFIAEKAETHHGFPKISSKITAVAAEFFMSSMFNVKKLKKTTTTKKKQIEISIFDNIK